MLVSIRRSLPAPANAFADDEDEDAFLAKKLRDELWTLGEGAEPPHVEAAAVARHAHDYFTNEVVMQTFYKSLEMMYVGSLLSGAVTDPGSIVEQPLKIPVSATAILYANSLDSRIAFEAVACVMERAQDAADEGRWTDFKLLLRFLACLQGIFEGDGVFPLLEHLFDKVVDLQSANEHDVRPLLCIHTHSQS